MTFRVLLTDSDLGDPSFERELLSRHVKSTLYVRDCLTEQDVLVAVDEVNPHAIISQWAPITAHVLRSAPECKVVSRLGIGLDTIDLGAAEDAGVLVKNVPHYCTEEVATHAVAMALSLWRQLPELDRALRLGEWSTAIRSESVKKLSLSTIGLIGMGRIGRLVADSFSMWGARVIVHDPISGNDPYERVDLQTLATQSDLISLHAPLTAQTTHIIDQSFLDLTRQQPIIVNVSRGGLIDEQALVGALHSGVVSSAGIDVFETEPLPADAAILTAPRSILTPHAAWCSRSALPALREGAVLNVVDALRNGDGR